MRFAITSLCLLAALGIPIFTAAEPVVADHVAADDFANIPVDYFDLIRANYDIFYGHTSHGSQINSGIGMLESENHTLYESPQFYEVLDDLGDAGDVSWVPITENYLDQHPECNLVMWSWCGGVADNTEEGIDIYLAAMEQLEADYPGVIFVYMTGHLEGGGEDDNLHQRNEQIRQYCVANDKVLYDFADIESWDPAGVYHPDDTDACLWCDDWCAENDCPSCSYCAHSHCFNCYRKARAFWWMMANLEGWNGLAAVPDVAVPISIGVNVPNPFNPQTTIVFRLEENAWTTIEVLDLKGRRVATIDESFRAAGSHEIVWNARGDDGAALASGVFVCRIRAGEHSAVRTITMLK